MRYDTGIVSGQEISPFYDPMIAKLITTGPTREAARKLMIEALTKTALFGPRTNRDFLIACLANEKFAEGDFSTAFIAEQFSDADLANKEADDTALALLAVRHFMIDRAAAHAKTLGVPARLLNFGTDETQRAAYKLAVGEEETGLTVHTKSVDDYMVQIGAAMVDVHVRSQDGLVAVMESGGVQYVTQAHLDRSNLFATIDGHSYSVANVLMRNAASDDAGDGRRVTAPMHGRVVELFVKKGDSVTSGDRLAIIEAMKMQHEILATVNGTVAEVLAAADEQIAADDLMVTIETDEE